MSRPRKKGTVVRSLELDAVFSAVSHATRRQILVCLRARGGAMTAGEIADRFKHSWPTTTRHLRVLEDAGLIEVEKEGRNRLYTLSSSAVIACSDWLMELVIEGGGSRKSTWSGLSYGKMRNARRVEP